MDSAEALQYAIASLGACIAAIMWWIGNTLLHMDDKLGRALTQIELHGEKIANLELIYKAR